MATQYPNYLLRLLSAQSLLRARRSQHEMLTYAQAFEECRIVLRELEAIEFHDPGAVAALGVLRSALDTSRVVLWDERGPAYAKLERMSAAQKADFGYAIDYLVGFFYRAPANARSRGQDSHPRP